MFASQRTRYRSGKLLGCFRAASRQALVSAQSSDRENSVVPIRLLTVDDQPIFLQDLCQLLEGASDTDSNRESIIR